MPVPDALQALICSKLNRIIVKQQFILYGEKLLESPLMEETYSKWPEWQKVYVKIKILTPGGCLPLPLPLPLPRGYIHV